MKLFRKFLAFGLVAIALLLPLTLAGIGVREGAYAGLLGLLGVPIEKAVGPGPRA